MSSTEESCSNIENNDENFAVFWSQVLPNSTEADARKAYDKWNAVVTSEKEAGLKEPKNVRKSDPFVAINERPVDDISLQFFYKPHTLT